MIMGTYILWLKCTLWSCCTLSRATALAILSVKNGLEALKTSPTPQQLLWDRTSTPLQLLIKEMPGENLPSFPDQYSMQFTLLWYKRLHHQSSHVNFIECGILNYTVAYCMKVSWGENWNFPSVLSTWNYWLFSTNLVEDRAKCQIL